MAIKELFQDARPQVLFDPRASQRIDPRFKFTRAGAASYYDSQGVLRYAPANQPRVGAYEPDANGVMQPVQGLMIEEASTNLFAQSTNVIGTDWNVDGISTTANVAGIIAPDGTETADRINYNGGTGSHRAFYFIGGTVRNETFSFFVKPAPGTVHFDGYLPVGGVAGIIPNDIGGGWNIGIDFSSNTLYRTNGFTVFMGGFGVSLELLPNGWRRISFSYRQIFIGSTSSFLNLDDRGAGFAGYTYGDVYIWGLQREASSYSTSYIPTAGSQVTRPADLLSIDTDIPSTGSLYIDAQPLDTSINTTLLSAANAANDKLLLQVQQPANLYGSTGLVYSVDGAFKPTLPFPVPGTTRERNLITWGANNYHYRADSARSTASSAASVPDNMIELGIGHDVTDPTKGFTGYINTVYMWPGEITPTVAEALVRGDIDVKDADVTDPVPADTLAFVFNTQGIVSDGNTQITLPLRGSTNNILVSWGDNTSSALVGTAASVNVTKTYSAAGIYSVQITSDSDDTNEALENLLFFGNNPTELFRVQKWGGTAVFRPTTMYRAFRDCTQLDFENAARTGLPDTSAVTNWQEAFYNCSSITGQFPAFDTSSATALIYTWYNCNQVTSYPQLNTSNVINFENTWYNNTSLTSFPNIDTSKGLYFGSPTAGSGTWRNCSGLTSFPLLDFSSAISLAGAWAGCTGLTSFPAINTASVTSFGETNQGAWQSCSSLTSFPAINTSNATTLARAWESCSSLTSFPSINTSNCQDFYNTWNNCSSLTSFPALDFSSATGSLGGATSGDGTWRNCSSLTSFPTIDTSGINGSIAGAWGGCSGLTSFPLLDFSNVVSFGEENQGAWQQCSGLTSFPSIDTSSAIRLRKAWYLCTGLTSFPLINTSSVTDMTGAWSICSGLTSFPLLDTSQVTLMGGAWNECNSLTAFPAIDTSNVTKVAEDGGEYRGAWAYCTGLTSFPALNLSNCQVFGGANGGAWIGCTGLTAFPSISFVAATTFWRCWEACTGMVDFPAGLFDGWTGTPVNNCFALAWNNCVALSATSVENILNSINASGRSAPTSGKDITISYNAGSGTPSISTAVTALKSRGWTITLNGVAQ